MTMFDWMFDDRTYGRLDEMSCKLDGIDKTLKEILELVKLQYH